MSQCQTTINSFTREDGTLKVSDKYSQLMRDSLADDSLYIRAKDTLQVIFTDLQLTEIEKGKLATEFVGQFSIDLSKHAMNTALTWATEERDGAYALAKLKADTENSLAQFEKIKSEICLVDAQAKSQCATTTATISSSIRENGKVLTFEADGCTPAQLDETGVKWHQARQAEADAYGRYADAFRQSGVVHIGTDISDSTKKGLSGDEDGHTYQKIINAERLRISYEDSKRNNAANSSSTMIASLLSSESFVNEDDVQRWRDAVDYLNKSHSTTSTS